MAAAMEDYLDGRLDSFAFDDVLFGGDTDDVVCLELRREIWYCYDDCTRHFNEGRYRLGLEATECFRRWIQLLRSDSEWCWKRVHSKAPLNHRGCLGWVFAKLSSSPAANSYQLWPWKEEAEWRAWAERWDIPS